MLKKIDPFQVFAITTMIIFPTMVLSFPKFLTEISGSIGWFVFSVAGSIIGTISYIILMLSYKYSDYGLISDVRKILGNYLSCIVIIPIIICLISNVIETFYFSVKIIAVIIEENPPLIFFIGIVLLAIYLSYKGIEIIARFSILMFIVYIAGFSIIIFGHSTSGFKGVNMDLLYPFKFNIESIIRGSFISIHWFLSSLFILLLWKPYLKDKKRSMKFSSLANLGTQLVFNSVFILALAFFGVDLAMKIEFPFYFYIKSFPIQGLEIVIFVSWLSITVAKFGIFYFTIIKAVSDVFYIRNYKRLVIPVSIMITSIAIFVYNRAHLFSSNDYIEYSVINTVVFYIPFTLILMFIYLIPYFKRLYDSI
jgi:uncharacterized protein YneF (UPF0154 family)